MAAFKDKTNLTIFTTRKRRNHVPDTSNDDESKKRVRNIDGDTENIPPTTEPLTTEPPSEYQRLVDNPVDWPMACDMDVGKWQKFYEELIKRRQIIRKHFGNDDLWLLKEDYHVGVETPLFHHIYDYLYEDEWKFGVLGKDFLTHKDYRLSRYRYRFVNKFAVLRQKLNLCSDTFHLAVAIFDRYLKIVLKEIIPEDLFVVSIICLNIAMKIEEVNPYTIENLYQINHLGTCDTGFCFNLERKICSQLDFRLNIPLSVQFSRMYAVMCEGESEVYNAARYCIDLSLQDYIASQYSVNFVAASCIFVALVSIKVIKEKFEEVWSPKLQCASGLLYKDIYPLIRNLCLVLNKQFYHSEYHSITDYYKAAGNYSAPATVVLNSKGLVALNEMFRIEEMNKVNNR